jgi:sugar/nucleoside kinase (ribokinase family)/D-arabinose 5-phosphate isomerase GutQ
MSDTERRHDVVGTGSMVLDRIFRVPRLLGREEKGQLAAEPGEAVACERVGGVVLNHLGWARLFGLRVAVFGKQADDYEGRALRAGMQELGIEAHLDLSGRASSFAQIFVDDAGERAIYMSRGATGELAPDDIDDRFVPLIRGATYVSSEVSQLPLRTVRRVFEHARAAGARTVLDLDVPLAEAVPWLGSEAELWQVLGLADVLKASRAAVQGLCAARDPEGIARELAARLGCSIVALTLGKDGAFVRSAQDSAHLDAAGVDVRDTTGAGDAFLGGFISGLRLGLVPAEAARLGNACGAACCERIGAFPDAPEACRRRALELFAALGGAKLDLPALDSLASEPLDAATLSFLSIAPREIERVARDVDAEDLLRATRLILSTEREGGRVHVTGVGKCAHVAAYAAALLSSTGTPSVQLDALEATHGSAGQIRAGDVVIAISNSGRTEELLGTVAAARNMGARLIALSESRESPLGREADVSLCVRVTQEGDPIGLAPRASTLAQVLVLAALSIELQVRKGMDRAEYHRRHPGGSLGKRSGS